MGGGGARRGLQKNVTKGRARSFVGRPCRYGSDVNQAEDENGRPGCGIYPRKIGAEANGSGFCGELQLCLGLFFKMRFARFWGPTHGPPKYVKARNFQSWERLEPGVGIFS